MTDSRLPNLTSNFRDFFGFKNLSPRRSRESGVGGFFRGKESGVGKARESESGVGVGNSVNRLPSPDLINFQFSRYYLHGGLLKWSWKIMSKTIKISQKERLNRWSRMIYNIWLFQTLFLLWFDVKKKFRLRKIFYF